VKREEGGDGGWEDGRGWMCLMPLTDEMEGNVSRRVMVYHNLLSPLVQSKSQAGIPILSLPVSRFKKAAVAAVTFLSLASSPQAHRSCFDRGFDFPMLPPHLLL
jgi:hypothetical protein